ncbi:regulatory protein, LuxR [Pseudonocardia sp. N23]|nr:regulatory protein, LuxR [Pseudonocardia sp. N23]
MAGRARQRLLERLRADTDTVVVSGPAGAGKTALVEEWARAESDVRILRISRHHNTAESLLSGILAVLGGAADLVDATEPSAGAVLVGRTVDAGPFTADRPCRLVLDGVDSVTDPDAELLLRELVEHRPPPLRLLVTTRHRNPSWLVRSRACGAATTITAPELRLRPADVASLLGADVPELDGWAMGVGLLAALGPAGADEAIRDFLRAEVTRRVTTEVRQLLHAVSVAGAVCPALAIRLTGNPAAGQLLAQFAEVTQFATVSEGPVFALHPVLARHLRDEFATERWESYVDVRRRYADWLVEEGQLDLSTRLYVELGEVATACDTLLAHWQHPVLSGHPEVVRDALGHLPPELVARDPQLCVVMAMVNLAAGDHRAWQRWADVAEVHEDVEMEPGLPVGVAVAVSRRLAAAVTSGTTPHDTVGYPLTGLWAAISEVADGLSRLWAGDHTAATAHFRRAEVASRIAGDQLALVHALSGLALAAALGGGDAMPCADEAIAAADRLSPLCRWVVAHAHLALATVHRSGGTTLAATGAANDALQLLSDFPHPLEQRTRARAAELLRPIAPPAEPRRPGGSDLSGRERRVLRALCGPLTLREIADELYVSHNTVKSQVRSIFRKLGVHDRAAAAAAARSWSMVER